MFVRLSDSQSVPASAPSNSRKPIHEFLSERAFV